MTVLFAEHALLPTGPAADVLIEIAGGRFSAVTPNVSRAGLPAEAQRLPGVVLPGFANAHSHAFHRALRGRTHGGGGSFWTWREAMYGVAARLDPDSYLQLARAVYAEMALSGVTAVGEFHYLHHGREGVRYADPNAMGEALRQAAAEAGIRLTLLDTVYLGGGLSAAGHQPLNQVQRRFSDGSIDAWADRVQSLKGSAGMRVGAAVHSVRAVPAEHLPAVVDLSRSGLGEADAPSPMHVHLSEQPAENDAALSFYGRTPTALLAGAGFWGPGSTAVHATHVTTADIETLGQSGSTACFCPTTERDLADGIGPARALADAGASLSLGSDQNAVVDLIQEAQALEADERLTSLQRGRFRPGELLTALTAHGSLGWPDAGEIRVGQRADLVAIRADGVRTAGSLPAQILFSGSAADVDTVLVDGVPIVRDGRHRMGDVGRLLKRAIEPLWDGA